MFSLTPIGRGKQISRTPKHTIRPSQESHAPFYDKSFKDEEAVGSDSGSETSPNVQVRAFVESNIKSNSCMYEQFFSSGDILNQLHRLQLISRRPLHWLRSQD